MEAVVDLIEVAFGDRLDPAGRATLQRMRRFARRGPLLQWLWALAGKATVAPGLVWEADGRLVGNVSLRRARAGGGYLVGNVVVDPDHQRQGIGTALMREAIRVISRRDARWVGLEVRVDNRAARRLYEQLGFREVGKTVHLLRPSGEGDPGGAPPRTLMRRGRGEDGEAVVNLMRAVIRAELRPLLEVEASDYRPGWGRRIEHWFRGEDELWWVCGGEENLQGAVRAVRRRGAFPNCMEILIREGHEAGLEGHLVRQGIVGLGGSPRKPVEICVPDARGSLLTALEEEGFRQLRVLVQMKRILKHRVPVRMGEEGPWGIWASASLRDGLK